MGLGVVGVGSLFPGSDLGWKNEKLMQVSGRQKEGNRLEPGEAGQRGEGAGFGPGSKVS